MPDPTIADQLSDIQLHIASMQADITTIKANTTAVSTAFLSGQINTLSAKVGTNTDGNAAGLAAILTKLSLTPSP